MNEDPESMWTELAVYGARYEADLTVARLETAGILTLVKSDDTGVLGLSRGGTGFRVFVPTAELENARDTLGLEESP